MSSPIEDFLRQAAERRVGKPPPVVAVPVEPVTEPVVPTVVVADVAVPDRPLEKTRLEHHIDTHDVADHAEHLGEQVSRADDVVDQHVHDVFDHQVGALSGSGDASDTVDTTGGRQLRRQLKRAIRSRTQIRQAVVFSEIVRRPEWRW